MSGEISLWKSISSPVAGCWNPNVLACRAWRGHSSMQLRMNALYEEVCSPRRIWSPPYLSSAKSGCPVCFMCARIWCVRPVSRRHSTSVTGPKRSSTRQWVTACLPVSLSSGNTAMRKRSFGSRPMLPVMVPSSCTKGPHTSALYRRRVVW